VDPFTSDVRAKMSHTVREVFSKLRNSRKLLSPRGYRIEIRFHQHTGFVLFLVGLTFAVLVMSAETLFVGFVSSLETPWGARLLLRLAPDDPGLEHKLGEAYIETNAAEGLKHLRRAAELAPASRLYWEDLASACDEGNDRACADRARQRLLELCPMVPVYHWYAGQRALGSQRQDEAAAQFRRLLELDPSYAKDSWNSLRAIQDPDLIFREILADSGNSELRLGFVDFLSSRGEDEAAYKIWQRVATNSGVFPFSSVQAYLDRLINHGRIREAAEVWHDLQGLGIVKKETNEQDSLIFNGGFEEPPLNAGLDWRQSEQLAYLALDVAASGAYQGAHCLRLDFTVSRNLEYEPVYQMVPVLANHNYRLEAYVRSERLTSDTGPSLRVRDMQSPSFPEATTETTIGTTPWHLIHVIFATGPTTQAVSISVWRRRSRVFPTEITGTFWLDAVSFKCVDCDAAPGPTQV
jgi:hypothetical protein